MKKGLVAVADISNTSYTFSIVEDVQLPTTITDFTVGGVDVTQRTATFSNLEVLEGTYITKRFVVDASLDQRFILDNSFIDTSTMKVYVKKQNEDGLGVEYKLIDNITNATSTSYTYLIQEVQDEKYELLFGDGLIGRKLETGEIITVNYVTTSGKDGNGAKAFSFAGQIVDSDGNNLSLQPFTITTNNQSRNGGEIEDLNSIKYFAPRTYSSQNRAVTGRDYESIIKEFTKILILYQLLVVKS